MRHRKRQAVSTRAASSATASRTRTGRSSTGPDLITLVMVGDGEAETGPLATSWHSNKFLNPITDGAVLPVLHLNGYKINNPTILARISHEEFEALFVGYGYTPYFVEGSDPAHLKLLEAWLRGYKPEEHFDEHGRLIPELKALAPKGHRRMSANPVANGGRLRRPLDMPDFGVRRRRQAPRRDPGRERPHPGPLPPGSHAAQPAELPRSGRTRPNRTNSKPSTRSPRRKSGWGSISPRTPTAANWPCRAGSWRCSASTRWKGGWKATC